MAANAQRHVPSVEFLKAATIQTDTRKYEEFPLVVRGNHHGLILGEVSGLCTEHSRNVDRDSLSWKEARIDNFYKKHRILSVLQSDRSHTINLKAGLRLAFHNSESQTKYNGLRDQYQRLQNSSSNQPVRGCYEFPLYFDVLLELSCLSGCLFGACLIGYRKWYACGTPLILFGLVGFYLLESTMAFGNPLIAWDLGVRSLFGRQTDNGTTGGREVL